ncbi:hypothetical protein SDC9_204146 [bioreactor metagenome]|uniref:Uncharacterized protein n=1 Tax=bioreactor metagenome TaxID=1076179 RepID=A0A645IZ60_9ZZZZ
MRKPSRCLHLIQRSFQVHTRQIQQVALRPCGYGSDNYVPAICILDLFTFFHKHPAEFLPCIAETHQAYIQFITVHALHPI